MNPAETVRKKLHILNHHAFPCDKLVTVSGFEPLPCSLGFGHATRCRVDQGTLFNVLLAENGRLRNEVAELRAKVP